MTPDEYRAKHRRCRTCEYARESRYENTYAKNSYAKCEAKNKCFEHSVLGYLGIKGIFCRMYEPRKYGW